MVHNSSVNEFTRRAEVLASLMQEFGLSEAEVKGEGWKVAFRKPLLPGESSHGGAPTPGFGALQEAEAEAPKLQTGTPVTSPMTGIYYGASSPTSPPFVSVGDRVEAGQVIALIEAMKVFNEVTATVAGTVMELSVENGALVNLGEPLMYLG